MTPANCSRDLGTWSTSTSRHRIGRPDRPWLKPWGCNKFVLFLLMFCLWSVMFFPVHVLLSIGTTKIGLWNLWHGSCCLLQCIWGTWTGDKPQDRDATSSPRCWWYLCNTPTAQKTSIFPLGVKIQLHRSSKNTPQETSRFQLALGGQNVNNRAGCSFLHQTLMEGLMLRHVNPPSPNPEKFLSVYCKCWELGGTIAGTSIQNNLEFWMDLLQSHEVSSRVLPPEALRLLQSASAE